jgi:hypothetical protein
MTKEQLRVLTEVYGDAILRELNKKKENKEGAINE